MADVQQAVLILDFGSQVTQLIARRVREDGVYCEIVPFNKGLEAIARLRPRAIILSGGPASVTDGAAPRHPPRRSPRACRCSASATASRPCGPARRQGGERRPSRVRPRLHRGGGAVGPVRRAVAGGSREQVWMSHGDRVIALPDGFHRLARTAGRAVRRHRRRGQALLRRAVPPRGGAHARRRQADPQLPVPRRRAAPATGPWRLPRARGRARSAPRSATAG